MLTELEPKDYHKAIPLFQGFDYSLSLPATLAGNNPDRIFVDNPKNPKTASALTVEGNFLAGNPADNLAVEAVSQFLQKKIFTGEIYLDDNTSILLAVEPIEWETKLLKMIPAHEIEKRPRYHYLCQELSFDWRVYLPPGYQVRSFDQNLLDDRSNVIPEEIIEWASREICWG